MTAVAEKFRKNRNILKIRSKDKVLAQSKKKAYLKAEVRIDGKKMKLTGFNDTGYLQDL